ncbi:TetR/AcrR family transcriptional regulator [Wenzhouxiangella sp. XN201]|uniref:TetR/AcrR family transcriptional regulator n=1 Tax=Wenzhouxiangella sp. XN201 TaxID=2710755 RepID=UPI0013CDC401|nr:TetR/AcrR family transcriptional regulator [Wenzhouxiangella sp. XN201]NEZ02988.1 TetR/AcrR family transcriptional regulator [Wenzhouxiangella sp. XN201]
MAKKRKYTQKKRAESAEETRRRIVEATVELHQEIGPRATTISAIAERAGVQRLTIYRHFPDETAVFQACTSHWLEDHPLPDPGSWQTIDDAAERTRTALRTLYRYYAQTQAMWDAAHRDEPDVPALQQPMAAVREYLAGIADDLVRALSVGGRPKKALTATAHHAVAFRTWQSLDQASMTPDQAAEAVTNWIAASR